MFENVKKKICFVLQVLMAFFLVAMVLLNVVQVVCRYFISLSIIWAEDVAIYCLHWCVCFAMPLLWLLKDHMIMDIANSIFPKKFLKVLDIVIDLIMIYFGVVFAYKGFYAAKVNKGYVMSVAGYDEFWKYIPYGIGGILLSLAAIMTVYERIRYFKSEVEGAKK